MNPSLTKWLVDPRDGLALSLVVEEEGPGGEIVTGSFVAGDGTTYAIDEGIPDFVRPSVAGQAQTAESFEWKWTSLEAVETASGYERMRNWYIQRYFGDDAAMSAFMADRRRILDCGCGSGLSSSTYVDESFDGDVWAGVDISGAVHLAQKRLRRVPNALFVRGDMMRLPFPQGVFDTIICEGTLHHTPSTRGALEAVVRHLESDGLILFYVYRRKSAIREFSDDYIRQQVAPLPPAEAMELVRPLTELGRALSGVTEQVTVPDIPVLGITAGRYDVQRLFYWHIAKIFWNDAYSFEENNHVNFDWYHPTFAHRQTASEVRQWCEELGLTVERLVEEEAGLTVWARRTV